MNVAESEAQPTAVDRALEQLSAGFDELLVAVEGGGLDDYDNAGLVGFLGQFERFRNRLPLIDHRTIGDAQRRHLPDALSQGTLQRVLTSALRLSPGEASRRVRAAEAVGPRISMLGEKLSETRPRLAAAQREGSVSPEQVDIIARALGKVDLRGFDPADIAAGEELLTGFAQTFGPKDLQNLADKTVDAINPDGTRPRDEINRQRRFFHLRSGKDGSYTGEFRLTGPLGAKLTALLSPLSKPRTDTDVPAGSAFGIDERTHGQRQHDALEDVCDRLLRAGGVPDSGGTPASVIVTIRLEDLLDQLGYGTTSDGTLISTREVLAMAGQADIMPALLTKGGALLDFGRSRRVATSTQTFALIARDQGCSFPGCAAPAEWCERHHIVSWADGGKTDLNNLTLLCSYHHHNFFARGWTCQLNADGLPAWSPPAWIDPERRPLINSRILEHHALQYRRRAVPTQVIAWPDVGTAAATQLGVPNLSGAG